MDSGVLEAPMKPALDVRVPFYCRYAEKLVRARSLQITKAGREIARLSDFDSIEHLARYEVNAVLHRSCFSHSSFS